MEIDVNEPALLELAADRPGRRFSARPCKTPLIVGWEIKNSSNLDSLA
jgi:hypothetical protein